MLEAETSFARATRPITQALKAVSCITSGELLPIKEGLSQLALLPPEPSNIPISAQPIIEEMYQQSGGLRATART